MIHNAFRFGGWFKSGIFLLALCLVLGMYFYIQRTVTGHNAVVDRHAEAAVIDCTAVVCRVSGKRAVGDGQCTIVINAAAAEVSRVSVQSAVGDINMFAGSVDQFQLAYVLLVSVLLE